ncbi:MAG: response regulator, partial [Oligoflexales bacterium]|nr:response regulator [Oligoflexales bacterium]
MSYEKKVRVMIADDSKLFQYFLEFFFKTIPYAEIIGIADNGKKAIELIEKNPPDILTLDINMPIMDGLQMLDQLNQLRISNRVTQEFKIIIVSSLAKRSANETIKALQKGAFDFITKPVTNSPSESVKYLNDNLLPKVAYVASILGIPVDTKNNSFDPAFVPSKKTMSMPDEMPDAKVERNVKAIVMGVSTGGPPALVKVLPAICQKVDLPIFIVQHMPQEFTESLTDHLKNVCSHKVKVGVDGELVQPKTVYIAPGDNHMVI